MDEPIIIRESPSWATVVKPHGMPSAPLREGEEGTLVSWFVRERPEAGEVIGRKPVERGLIHRLDTATGGIVLFAKNQKAYDFLVVAQNDDRIVKTYVAYCERIDRARGVLTVPLMIESRFRPYGPGRKEVRPLFPLMRGYDAAGKEYTTTVEGAEPAGDEQAGCDEWALTCVISRGYRHQIRAHLSWLGFPIIGDDLYNPSSSSGRLELHAVAISFPDPDSGSTVSVSLPRPDKTIR